MRRILIATDLSDVLDDMVDAAVDLALPSQADVYVIYCHGPHDDYVRPEDNEAQQLQRRQNVDEIRRRLQQRGVNVPHCQQMATDNIPRSVLHEIERNQIDLLIVGMHRQPQVFHYLGDRVRERLLQQAPCPVLVVKPDTAPI